MNLPAKAARNEKKRFASVLSEYDYDLKRNKLNLFNAFTVVAYFIIFKYVPLFGVQFASKIIRPLNVFLVALGSD